MHDQKEQPMSYRRFPEVLRNHEYYIDVKRDFQGRLLKWLSKTGLEALACGLKLSVGMEK